MENHIIKSESEIQKDIIDYLKTTGSIVIRMNSGSLKYNVKLAPVGTPDLLAVLKTMLIWIEVKTETGKLRPAQVEMIKELRLRNQIVIVARSVDDVIKAISSHK
ncbi:MAG: VRR-NUC domain-containing protein [Gammaproteobacteria bacterium]|nr:VRR-NUC domain-containing protein [Gammaproteobacteria bacterium]